MDFRDERPVTAGFRLRLAVLYWVGRARRGLAAGWRQYRVDLRSEWTEDDAAL